MDFNRTVGGDIVIDVIFNNKITGGMRTKNVVDLDINDVFQLASICGSCNGNVKIIISGLLRNFWLLLFGTVVNIS